MKVIERLKQLFKPTVGDIEFFDKTVSWASDGVPFANPKQGNEAYITEGYQKNAAIYSIINMITRNSTMIPFKVYEIKNQSMKKDYEALTSGLNTKGAIIKASNIKAQAFTEVTDSGILDVLQNPNSSQSWSSFIRNYIGFGKLTGNRYIYGVRDGSGRVKEMHILPSQHVQIISGGKLNPIKGYSVRWEKRLMVDFEPDEILHVKDFNPYYDFSGSHLYGQSPLQAGYRNLMINNQIVDTTKTQLEEQSARGILATKEMDGIDKAQAIQLDKSIRAKLKGANGSVAITNQPMEWINFGLSAADMELINQGAVSLRDLCNLYGVPVQLMNDTSSSSYNNVKEAKSFLFQNAINPEMIRLRDELNRWFVPMWGKNLYLDFDFTVIPELQEDISEMVDQLDKAWYMTPNEKRKTLYMPADTDNPQMEEYFVPVNLMPMKNMDLQTEQFLNEVARLNPNNEDASGATES